LPRSSARSLQPNAPKRIAAPPPAALLPVLQCLRLESRGDLVVLDVSRSSALGPYRHRRVGVPVGVPGASVSSPTPHRLQARSRWQSRVGRRPGLRRSEPAMARVGLHEPCRWGAALRDHGRRPPLPRFADGRHSRIPTVAGPAEPPRDIRVDLTSIGYRQGHDQASAPGIRDSQSSIAISLASPPGVLAVGDGFALVTRSTQRQMTSRRSRRALAHPGSVPGHREPTLAGGQTHPDWLRPAKVFFFSGLRSLDHDARHFHLASRMACAGTARARSDAGRPTPRNYAKRYAHRSIGSRPWVARGDVEAEDLAHDALIKAIRDGPPTTPRGQCCRLGSGGIVVNAHATGPDRAPAVRVAVPTAI